MKQSIIHATTMRVDLNTMRRTESITAKSPDILSLADKAIFFNIFGIKFETRPPGSFANSLQPVNGPRQLLTLTLISLEDLILSIQNEKDGKSGTSLAI